MKVKWLEHFSEEVLKNCKEIFLPLGIIERNLSLDIQWDNIL